MVGPWWWWGGGSPYYWILNVWICQFDGRETIPTGDFIDWIRSANKRNSRPIVRWNVTLVCRYPAAEATQKLPMRTCTAPEKNKSCWLHPLWKIETTTMMETSVAQLNKRNKTTTTKISDKSSFFIPDLNPAHFPTVPLYSIRRRQQFRSSFAHKLRKKNETKWIRLRIFLGVPRQISKKILKYLRFKITTPKWNKDQLTVVVVLTFV